MMIEEEKVPEGAETATAGTAASSSPSDGIDEILSFDDKLVLLTASMGYDFDIAQNALEAAGGDIEIAIEIIMGDETQQCNEENTQRLLAQLKVEEEEEVAVADERQRQESSVQDRSLLLGGRAAAVAQADVPQPVPGGEQQSNNNNNSNKFSHVGKTPKEVLDHYSRQLLGDKYHPQVRQHVKSGCKSVKTTWTTAITKLKEIDEENKISLKGKIAINECDRKMRNFDEKHQWSSKVNAIASKANESAVKVIDTAKRSLVTTSTPSTTTTTTTASTATSTMATTTSEQRQDVASM